MSKGHHINERTDDDRKTEFLCTLGNVCPECGELCEYEFDIPDGEDEPEEIEIVCDRCGRMTAIRNKGTGRWTVPERDIPFIPSADDNTATLYQRFDPSDYGDEESAVSVELELLERLIDQYTYAGYDEDIAGFMDRKAELVAKAYEFGLKGYEAEYACDLLSSIDDGGDVKAIRRKVKSILNTLDLEGTEDVLDAAYVYSDEGELNDIKEKAAERIMAFIRGGRGTKDHLHDIVDGYELFAHVGMNERSAELLESGYHDVKEKIMNGGDHEGICKYILRDYVVSTVDKERLKEAMGLLEIVCDGDYSFCELSIIHYVSVMFDDEDDHDHLMSLLNNIIYNVEKEIESRSDGNYLAATGHLLRYCIDHKRSDLIAAADHSVDCIISGYSEVYQILEACINDPRMDRKNFLRLKNRLRSFEQDP